MATRPILPGTELVPPTVAGSPNLPVVTIGAEKPKALDLEKISFIISRLEGLAKDQVTAKQETEERWIENIRAYHGIYDQTTEKNLKSLGQSRAFVKATRSKTVALEARLFDNIFPTDDRNYEISATPVAKLSKEAKEAVQRATNAGEQATQAETDGDMEKAAQIVAEGNDQAARAEATNNEIAKATLAAKLMQEEMDDQLIETKYPAHSRDLIHQACQIGCGILKGPMRAESTRGKWLPEKLEASQSDQGQPPAQNDNWVLEQTEDERPLLRWCDAWSFFPDMSARRIEEAEFTFERHLWTKRDLRRMVQTHGFSPDAVRELLREDRSRKFKVSDLNYLTKLRSITGEGQDGSIKGRFVGWEYHGPLECEEVVALLRAAGEEQAATYYEANDDPLNEFRVLLYFCEGTLLKIAPEYPLDSGETLYSVFNVEESEVSIFGYGIPEIMADSQNALNSAWRMALDNSSLSVGPQMIVDKEAIMPADNSWKMLAKKIWYRIKPAAANAHPPIEFFNVPNNMEQIAAIIKIALDFIDMETGIPMPQQGEQGTHTTQTVGGMAILQNASNIIFRRMVKNYDDGIITPTMRRLYDWNMQHSKRSEIKGDMSVDARGSSVLLVKEVQAQNLMFIVTQLLSNPTFSTMIKPYAAVERLFQSMMIKPSDIMETEDDWKDNIKLIAEQEQPADPATINAQARIESANIMAKTQSVRDEVNLMVAQIRERTELVQLAQAHNLTLEQLKTQLALKQLDVDSGERRLAVEVAVEERMAEEARARGDEPSGSGGSFSAGGGDEQGERAE